MKGIGFTAAHAAAVGAIGLATLTGGAASAAEEGPITIGVIAESQAVAGASIPLAAQMAADEINANGGIDGRKIEIIAYDDHSSAAEAVRAFQRVVKVDGADAVIGSYISEVVLALVPWASRLQTPMISPGAASDLITKAVHDDYEANKYVFQGYLPSTAQADMTCAMLGDALGKDFGMDSAVIFSEDAAWTGPLDQEYLKCLPKAGFEVLEMFEISPDTTDFTPIFNQIVALDPDLMVTGMAHIGTQPVVQWKNQRVPIPFAGINAQASSSSFWDETNGATNYVVFQAVHAPNVAITEKTIPFAEGFKERFGNYPSYAGYTAYDDVYMIAEAIERAGTTEADALVTALEKTDYVGTIGRIQFHGKDNRFVHSPKIGDGFIEGLLLQYQDGKQVVVWPDNLATGKLTFPDYLKPDAD